MIRKGNLFVYDPVRELAIVRKEQRRKALPFTVGEPYGLDKRKEVLLAVAATEREQAAESKVAAQKRRERAIAKVMAAPPKPILLAPIISPSRWARFKAWCLDFLQSAFPSQ